MDGALRILRSLSTLLVACTLAGCGGAGDGLHVIRFPHATAPGTPKGQTAQRFKEEAEARFPERVRVDVFPSAQLMEDSDSLEALAFGEIQMIAVSLSLFDRMTPAFQIFDLPFLFPDLQAVGEFQHGPAGQRMLETLADRGILGLTYWHNGMKQLSGPRPLRRPEDAAGLKFRIMESDVLQAQVLAFGGSPQKMAFGEVYQALQTGAVDAQENTWSNIHASRFFEVQPYITETNHGYIGYLVAVNPRYWRGLPADLRDGLEEILEEVTAWGNARAAEINAEHRQAIVESGRSQIITLGEEERDAWEEAMRPVWSQFSDAIGPELIEAALAR
jgi:C4-dicarboxylate-binding protein DctP